MSVYSQTKYGSVVGSFSVFFAEEVAARLSNAPMGIEQAYASGSITRSETVQLNMLVADIMPVIDKVVADTAAISMNETLTHGNLTLENTLYNPDTNKIILIDPYSETYSESIFGDYSQLMQSSVSLYESEATRDESSIQDLFNYCPRNIAPGVFQFGECLKAHVAAFGHNDRKLVALFHGAQFVRMFPFKIQKTPRLATYFLLHGIKIIQDALQDA
jgi:hypothetical protein